MPGMERKEKLAETTARNNCVHCHMIHDAEQNQWRKVGTLTLDRLYRWPLPDNAGMHIDRDDGRRIETVRADATAAKVGLAPGDVITTVNGQPITSIADIQWVLHNTSANGGTIDVVAERDGKSQNHAVALAKGWKKIDFTWRGSGWSLRPSPGFWAPVLAEKETKAMGDAIPAGPTPLRGQYIPANQPEGKAAKQARLKEGDGIIATGGQPNNTTP